MKNKGYYTQDPTLMRENDERMFLVKAEHLLSKRNIEVETDDYDYHDDDDWYSINTSNTDFLAAYQDNHFTPIEMLKELKSYIEKEMSVLDATNFSRLRHLKRMLQDCQGWTCSETIVEED